MGKCPKCERATTIRYGQERCTVCRWRGTAPVGVRVHGTMGNGMLDGDARNYAMAMHDDHIVADLQRCEEMRAINQRHPADSHSHADQERRREERKSKPYRPCPGGLGAKGAPCEAGRGHDGDHYYVGCAGHTFHWSRSGVPGVCPRCGHDPAETWGVAKCYVCAQNRQKGERGSEPCLDNQEASR